MRDKRLSNKLCRLAGIYKYHVSILVFLTGICSASAHPHAWIDLKTELRFNAKGEAVSIQQIWLLDPAYSSFATIGLNRDHNGRPDWEALDALLHENMKNLRKYRYFTEIYQADRSIRFREVIEMSSRMVGDRLEMRFVIPFMVPINIEGGKGFTYRVFDPTYYIEIIHAENADSVALVAAPNGCRSIIHEPTPDPGTILFAASLDKTQSAGTGLGKFFAQTVNISCSRTN